LLVIATAGFPAAIAFLAKTLVLLAFAYSHLYALQIIRKQIRRFKWFSTSSQESSQHVESYSYSPK
jgi:hypothetical protein